MSERGWKRAERRIAAILGGRRVPVSGRARGDAPDIEHPRLAVEVKNHGRLPAWIEDAMRQAEASAREGRTPVTVLHETGRRYGDSLVLVRLSDFACLLDRDADLQRAARRAPKDGGQDHPPDTLQP